MQNNHYEIKLLEINHLDEVIEIFRENYRIEKSHHESFIRYSDIQEGLSMRLKDMLVSLEGWGVFDCDRIVGYMIGFETGPLFGNNLGVVVPLHGHGAKQEDKDIIYQLLFNHAAEKWTSKDIFSIAIIVFAHDEHLKSFWFQNGFGMRCVDAIRGLESFSIDHQDVVIKKIEEENIDDLLDLHKAHNIYYRTSPIFMPNEDEDPKEDLLSWLHVPHRHLFVAYINQKAVGYMRIQDDGESVLTISSNMMNITGAFVDPFYRNKKIGSMLLKYTMDWMKTNGYQLLGVDFESINPKANQFWNQYFKAYTISLTRRIDENIKNYK